MTGTQTVGGAGIGNSTGATLTIRNSTISGNSSDQQAGGIVNQGSVTLDSVTITNDSATLGGSGYSAGNGSLTIRNSILAGNTGAPDCSDLVGTVTDQGHNLVQSQNNCGFVNGANGTILGQAANLGPLADNGGDTQTHLPNAGSPVINAGDTTLGADQRGIARPQGPADDIGAVEALLPGTIRIVKVAQPQGATVFGFYLSGAEGRDFTLVDDGLGTRNTFTSTQTPGTYVVTENAQSGWFVSKIVCDDADSTVDIAARKATIRLGSQETVTCTYTNSKLGSLTIVKKRRIRPSPSPARRWAPST